MRRDARRRHLALVRRAAGYLKPYRGRAAAAGFCVILSSVLQAAPALIFRALVDDLTRHHPRFSQVAEIVALGLIVVIVASLISLAATYLAAQISEKLVYDLRQQLFEHMLGQPVAYFTRQRSGDILSHLINDVDGIETVLSQALLSLIGSGCLLVSMVAVMLFLDWRLALLTFVLVPGLTIPFRIAGRATFRSRLAVQEQLTDVTAYLQENLGLSGVMLVKAFARGRLEHQRFAALNEELRRRQVRATMTARWFGLVLGVLQAAAPIVLLLVGGLFIAQGSSRLGTVLTFATIISGQFGASIQNLGSAALATVGSLAMWRRVFDVLDTPAEIVDRSSATKLTNVLGEVRLDNVTFSYPGAARPALRKVSAKLAPGQLIALVGPSGAGKSTFSALVARFIDPQQGAVTIDGLDLRDVTLSSLHRAVGVVFQDTFLFHTSLRENLRYGRPHAGEEELAEAVRDANLEPLIASLPDGLDTLVGERGHRLSGGEKQRVAIARVLLKDPRILLLDEATAHLDNVSERLIQAALERLFVGRTSLVIAHRLSTVVSADEILVLDQGTIVERGSHEQLVAAGGLYTSLHAGQLLTAVPERRSA